jgi:hypothetical protein
MVNKKNNACSFLKSANIKNLELIQNFFDGRLSEDEKNIFHVKLRDPKFVKDCELFTDLVSRHLSLSI